MTLELMLVLLILAGALIWAAKQIAPFLKGALGLGLSVLLIPFKGVSHFRTKLAEFKEFRLNAKLVRKTYRRFKKDKKAADKKSARNNNTYLDKYKVLASKHATAKAKAEARKAKNK